jgi:hypothetical protein
MESWEFELEYLTWDSYEKAISKAAGVDQHVEEFAVDDEDFKTQVEEFNATHRLPDGFSPTEWEEIDGTR